MEVTKLDTRKLDAIALSLDIDTDRALASVAFQVEAEAKVRAPVDTGALKGGITTTKKRRGLYWVHDDVEYGIFVELGHLTRPFKKSYGAQNFVRSRPFMVPAVEAVRRYIDKMFEGLFK